jgi:hypothetical protein
MRMGGCWLSNNNLIDLARLFSKEPKLLISLLLSIMSIYGSILMTASTSPSDQTFVRFTNMCKLAR